LSKIKCFSCHNNGHYASQCKEEEKKGNGKTLETTSTKTQIDEFVVKFEKDYTMVSCLSTSIIMRSAWFLDNGASCHLIEA
jgi:hypothetical protein